MEIEEIWTRRTGVDFVSMTIRARN